MASEVDICNLALGHLGDNATVASIIPPEGSAQAEHCARFYPIARDSLLEMHQWNFATRRATLAQVTNNWSQWAYAYAPPNGFSDVIAILPPDATDDYVTIGSYTPQPFAVETQDDGTEVIYTNQANAIIRYTALITDSTKFPPTFVMALSWHLASMLAGPVIKGDQGAAEAKRCTQMMAGYMSQVKESDANQRKAVVEHIVPWTAGR